MSFQTALSGLFAAQTNLNVTGNNIANASTNGFKRSRAEFADLYASSFASTSLVGNGVRVASVSQQFAQGNVEFTDNSLDLSISGEGFFILREGGAAQTGSYLYTRAGAYQVDRDGFVVNSRGQRLQGYAPDTMGDLFVSNVDNPARATESTNIRMNLDAYSISPVVSPAAATHTTAELAAPFNFSTIAGNPASFLSDPVADASDFEDVAFSITLPDGTVINVDTTGETFGSVADLANYLNGLSALFTVASTASDELSFETVDNVDGEFSFSALITGASTQGAADDDSENITFTIRAPGSDTTRTIVLDDDYSDLQELADAIQAQSGGDFTVSVVDGRLVFESEEETSGNFVFGGTDSTFVTTGSTSTAGATEVIFRPDRVNSYNFSTSTTVYDSLGRGLTKTIYFVKDNDALNSWSSYVFINGDPVPEATVRPDGSNEYSGQSLQFNSSGQLVSSEPVSYGTYDPGDGANPLDIVIDYTNTTQFASNFAVNSISQDGYTTGRISGINIDQSGAIYARYTNGQSEVLGTVSLARFDNPNGLQPIGDTNWVESFSSGQAVFGAPGTSSLGVLESGALEASNVEISTQLVNMIIAQRDFQANAKMISTQDQITQTIINIR